jgi:AsmA family protein
MARAATGGKRGRVLLLGALLFLLALTALAAVWDWNWFKPWVERAVEARTGRSFRIGGDLDVDLGLPSATITAGDVHLANAAWSKSPEMFSARSVEIELALWPLLRGRFDLPVARADHPRLLLERSGDKPGNWLFERREGKRRPLGIGDLQVTDGKLDVQDAPMRTALTLDVHSVEPREQDALAPLQVEGTGRYRGFDFDLEGRIESPLALRAQGTPYWVDLTAHAGSTRAHARGRLSGMVRWRNLDLDLTLQGSDLIHLDTLIGVVTPSSPPYRMRGQLHRRGDVWRYDEVSGTVGDTDLRGNVTLTLGRDRPLLQADMVSQKLDFDDLAGFVGAPPSGERGETATPQQRAAAAALARSERILPRREWNAQRLRKMDADVQLHAISVDAGVLPIESFKGRMRLENGIAVIDPLVLGVAGGEVRSTMRLDASREPYAASANVTMRALELPKLFAKAELTRSSIGRVGGHLALEGEGNSLAALLATSDGEIGLVMGKGRISNLLLEVAGLDVAEALKFLLGKDRVVPLRCAYADFAAEDGIVSTRRFVFDTTDTVLYGEGKLDLREERLDFELRPKPKDRSLVSLRSPLEVDGRLKDPDIHPKPGPLALRGLAAAALYAIAPPATLLALIETGPGKDANCDLDAVAAQDEAE